MTKFRIKNQKDKEHFFIFPIKKKMDVLRVNLVFKKNSNARHRSAISRVLKR
jgi:hypothetical protein